MSRIKYYNTTTQEWEYADGLSGGTVENAVLYTPQTLTDAQKAQARENIGAGAGGGGTDDYEALGNKPSINGVELIGNKTSSDLNIAPTDAQVENAVSDWLDDHPEATTTVQDGSISKAKLAADVVKATYKPNDEIFGNTTQAEGFGAWAEMFQKVKNEVMTAYDGDINKIPLILVTDAHGGLNGATVKGYFQTMSELVNWHDVSKVINLGDSVTNNFGTMPSTSNISATSAELKKLIDVFSPIPMEKQFNVFGNHDTWFTVSGQSGYRCLPKEKLQQYFRTIDAHRTTNEGYFVIHDDYRNIKYVVISGFERTPSQSIGSAIGEEFASPEQIEWLIKEFEKNDGYDIVVVSHCPVVANWQNRVFPSDEKISYINNSNRWAWIDTDKIFLDRKKKSVGTFVDGLDVVHTYDFSECKSDLICCINGHLHYDSFSYINSEILSVGFSAFTNAGKWIYYILIDKDAQKFRVWKMSPVNLNYEQYDIPLSVPEVDATYNIRYRCLNVSPQNYSMTIRHGQPYHCRIVADSGKTRGDVRVTMGGIDVTDTVYADGWISIGAATGDIIITAVDSASSIDTEMYCVQHTESSNVNDDTTTSVYGPIYYAKPVTVLAGGSYIIKPSVFSKSFADGETISNATNCKIFVTTNGITTEHTGFGNITVDNITNDVVIEMEADEVTAKMYAIGEDGEKLPMCGITFDKEIEVGSNNWYGGFQKYGSNPAVLSFYDENHNFISQSAEWKQSDGSDCYGDIPANAKYIKYSIYAKANHTASVKADLVYSLKMNASEFGIYTLREVTKDTTAVIAEEYKYYKNGQNIESTTERLGITDMYEYEANEGVSGTGVYRLTPNHANIEHTVTICTPYYIDGVFKDYGQVYPNQVNQEKVNGVSAGVNGMKFTLFLDSLDYSYAYSNKGGEVLFAGKYTPYYGLANIDGTLAT